MGTTDRAAIATLRGHIRKHLDLLEESQQEIAGAFSEDIPRLGKTPRAAVLIAGLLENYYTCAETVFVRISQFFENNLDDTRWHKDLLERMTLEIEPVRPRVISQPVKDDLVEIMRFRHFRRYNFWDGIRLGTAGCVGHQMRSGPSDPFDGRPGISQFSGYVNRRVDLSLSFRRAWPPPKRAVPHGILNP